MSYSIILVDSHTVIRKGIVSLFNSDDDIVLLGDVSTGEECLELLKTTKPNIVISDICLSDMDGCFLYEKIKEYNSDIKVSFFTESDKTYDIINAYDNDVDGYICKNNSYEEFKNGIVKIISGEKYIDQNILPILNKKLLERDSHLDLLERLTKREKQILICVTNGLSNKEIAGECDISERTVKNHLSSVFQKIEVADRTQAAIFAIKTDLVRI